MKTKIEIEIDACGKYCGEYCDYLNYCGYCKLTGKNLEQETPVKFIRSADCITAEQKGGEK